MTDQTFEVEVFQEQYQRCPPTIEMDAGHHVAEFDGAGLPSGMYFYRLRAGMIVETKRLVLAIKDLEDLFLTTIDSQCVTSFPLNGNSMDSGSTTRGGFLSRRT
jgi:hypothetical protein